MRNLLIASLMTSAIAVAAHAGSISFDSRADYEAKNYNDASNSRNYNKMYLQTLRLDAKGNFDEATSYRLRLRFNRTPANVRTADSLNDATDFAFIQHKWMDNLSVQLGKLGTEIGGFEGMTPGSDLYFTSLSYGTLAAEQGALRYATGVKLMYKIADQEINLMTVNQQTDAKNANTATPSVQTFDQTHNAMGVVYKGSFMDKVLLPYLSYFMDDVQATTSIGSAAATFDKKYNYMTAGIKWDAKPVFVEADYSMNNYKNKSILDETDTSTSIVATVGYQLDNWVAKLKYEASEGKAFSAANTSTKTTYTGMQLAAEYMPTGDKNFRYHAAYVTRDTKPDTAGAQTQTEQTAIVGVKLYADFLK